MLAKIFDNEDVKMSWLDVGISLFLFLVCFFIFSQSYHVQFDMASHLSSFLKKYLNSGRWFNLSYNNLLGLSVCSLALFKRQFMTSAFPCLLSITVVLKYLVIRAVSLDYLSRRGFLDRAESLLMILALAFLCFASHLIAFFQLALNNWQADIPRINIWHNPTSVAVMPFVVLLFYFSFRVLEEPKVKYFIFIGILVILNAFIKPSFLLPWVPAFSMFFVFSHADKQESLVFKINWKKMICCALYFAPLLLALCFIKSGKETAVSSLEISFIHTLENHFKHDAFQQLLAFCGEKLLHQSILVNSFWQQASFYFLVYKPLSILLGLAFPIFYFWVTSTKKNLFMIFAWTLVGVSIVISLLLHQKGQVGRHLNLTWQISMATFVLFFVSLLRLATEKDLFPKPSWPLALASGVFLVHIYQGLLYLQRFFFNWMYR